MKIAVTYDNERIFQHFGHTEQFKIYDIENDKIISKTVIGTDGQGHGALSSFLSERDVDVLICGGIGGGAINALNELGIKLFGGVSGDCDEAVQAFLNNELAFNPNVRCSHHDHEHGNGEHTCGEHGCGKGSCRHD
ncbi:MAG: dinitrogenase iron-molybdenum cofactor biosynthesis protein [Clostridia bacterium]|nr:dinitrogenase iron-molybdenum cofactor biosynthesis protein [Clostridia bacterium]